MKVLYIIHCLHKSASLVTRPFQFSLVVELPIDPPVSTTSYVYCRFVTVLSSTKMDQNMSLSDIEF